MKNRLFMAMMAALVIVGCSPRIIETVRTETVREVRDSLVWRDSVIRVPIPLESNQVIAYANDTTHLETSVAESDAWIDTDGFLHHTLHNKRTFMPFTISFPEWWRISKIENTEETTHVITREIKVEKPLSWWQKVKIKAFPWLMLVVLGFGLWTFRKSLTKLIQPR